MAAPTLTPEQRKEARRRRAQGARLQELAHSYNVGISLEGVHHAEA
jgi:hypothetical protein